MEILEDKENPFLKRREVKVRIDHPNQATPSKTKITEMVAEKLGVKKELVEVKKVFSACGKASCVVKIYVKHEA